MYTQFYPLSLFFFSRLGVVRTRGKLICQFINQSTNVQLKLV